MWNVCGAQYRKVTFGWLMPRISGLAPVLDEIVRVGLEPELDALALEDRQ
ncbi:hypothetical protein OJ998_20450 [Solirubrobacter taibaiensis]|nr:hypothetical protein [Solirubrobacter taibaiensis]